MQVFSKMHILGTPQIFLSNKRVLKAAFLIKNLGRVLACSPEAKIIIGNYYTCVFSLESYLARPLVRQESENLFILKLNLNPAFFFIIKE